MGYNALNDSCTHTCHNVWKDIQKKKGAFEAKIERNSMIQGIGGEQSNPKSMRFLKKKEPLPTP